MTDIWCWSPECYMILSRLRSVSSCSFSWLDTDPRDDAPQICISISANRCSTSHCCCVSFVLNDIFSDSTVCRRERNRFISSSKASCEPSNGVAPDSRCVSEPTTNFFREWFFFAVEKKKEKKLMLKVYWINFVGKYCKSNVKQKH